jgi:hypothetical protein
MASNLDFCNMDSFEYSILESRISFVESNGQKHKDLVLNNFKFKWHRNNKNGTTNYQCRFKDPTTKKSCPASCTLDREEGDSIKNSNLVHVGHAPLSQCHLDVDQFKRDNKKATTSSASRPIQQIFEETQNELAAKYTPAELTQNGLNSYHHDKSALYKLRAKTVPSLPVNAASIMLEEKHKMTIGVTPAKFLIYDNEIARRLMVFCGLYLASTFWVLQICYR